jgi:hypothetical protein
MNLSNISNLLAQKYVISPLDGNQYCRANGYFKRHLHDNIIPIVYGFAHNIPVDVIAATDNLQMLHYKENIAKGAKYENI